MLALAAAAPAAADRAAERELMVLTVANMAETVGIRAVRRLDPKVLGAMRSVPRHLFVPEQVQAQAYHNVPLPIGHDQTISQPYIVALMTHLLEVEPGHHVLEIGTGSGYQAAILSGLAARIHSVEIVGPLAERAAATLSGLGYANVIVRAGDGYDGWPDAAPFDRIIVTAAARGVPRPLIDQLKRGGRIVIPVSGGPGGDILTVVDKDRNGRIRRRSVLPVRFVPLVRASR